MKKGLFVASILGLILVMAGYNKKNSKEVKKKPKDVQGLG
jgi:hypothetical protein